MSHSYVFLVRQRFGNKAHIDSFIEYPAEGIDNNRLAAFKALSKKGNKHPKVIEAERIASSLHGMELRMRSNTDIYPHLCKVNTEVALLADELNAYIQSLDLEQLTKFLNKAKVN